MDELRDSARKKFRQLRKAVSLERVDKETDKPAVEKSPFIRSPSLKSLTNRLSFKKRGRKGKYQISDDEPAKPV